MTVLVASTVAPYKRKDHDGDRRWLKHAGAWREAGHDFFCAVEQSLREESAAVIKHPLLLELYMALEALEAEIWHFGVDDNEDTLTSRARLVRICTGRNLALEQFNRHPGRWEAVLFLDTDVEPPPDAVERMLEVDRQLVGLNVPIYALDGPPVRQWPGGAGKWAASVQGRAVQGSHIRTEPWFPEGADVREHWNTAGCLLVRAEAANALRWGWDLSNGKTDDPWFQGAAQRMGFGMTWVRHDVTATHHPSMIYPLEQRGLDLAL